MLQVTVTRGPLKNTRTHLQPLADAAKEALRRSLEEKTPVREVENEVQMKLWLLATAIIERYAGPRRRFHKHGFLKEQLLSRIDEEWDSNGHSVRVGINDLHGLDRVTSDAEEGRTHWAKIVGFNEEHISFMNLRGGVSEENDNAATRIIRKSSIGASIPGGYWRFKEFGVGAGPGSLGPQHFIQDSINEAKGAVEARLQAMRAERGPERRQVR